MIKRYLRPMLVAAALVSLVGCDAVSDEQLLAPSANVSANAATIAQTRSVAVANKAAGIIDAQGGVLVVNGHRLVVPANAVSSPTFFTMHVVEAKAVHVRLRATRILDGAPVTQFPVAPVTLTLDAADVAAADLWRLKVVYLRDGTYGGAKEILSNSVVDLTRLTVSADLTHFSDYAAILD